MSEEERCNELNDPNGSEYVLIGWISHGMDTYKAHRLKAYGVGDVRKPPKIYRTEQIANRYGEATPVFIKIYNDNHTQSND